jgi:hypothetical protein
MKSIKSWRDQMELWLTLTFLTALGWSFGLILTALIIGFFDTPPGSLVVPIISGILGGAIIGLLHVIILRNMVRSIEVWILTCITGWTLGVLLTLAVIQLIPGVAGWLVGGALGGTLFGFSQKTGLRSKSGIGFTWVVLNALGWLIVYGAGTLLPDDMALGQIASFSQPLALGMLGWVLVGALAVLVQILISSGTSRKDKGDKIQWWP